MVFSSVLFLFYFLPITLILYSITGNIRNYALLALSLLFYFCGGVETFPLILVSIILNYVSGLVIDCFDEYRSIRRVALFISVIANLGLLFYFKYFNFFVEIYTGLADIIGTLPAWNPEKVMLPIGISFFTFQGMAYVIDVYRGQTEAQRNVAKIALYISMFPQLIAGPIVRYSDICNDMERLGKNNRNTGWKRILPPIDLDNLAWGGVKFIVGLSKKVILADVLAESVDKIFAMDVNTIPMGMAWFGAITYTLQIYFDFSGYSDMAIGIGKILGYSFPENFNLPYISKSVREFWRRWHISLSTWFRDYLYIPLGGSRKGNTYVNLFIVFLCTGLWHGAAWSFVVWGLWHGVFMIAERLLAKNRKEKSICFKVVSWMYTMLVVILGWVIFRSENLLYSVEYIKDMIGISACEFNHINTLYFMNARNVFTLIVAILISLGVPQLIISREEKNEKVKRFIAVAKYPVALLLYGLSLLIVINGNYSPFIYFRF